MYCEDHRAPDVESAKPGRCEWPECQRANLAKKCVAEPVVLAVGARAWSYDQIAIVLVVTTALTMLGTGLVAERLARAEGRGEAEDAEEDAEAP